MPIKNKNIIKTKLKKSYGRMDKLFGELEWWPADTAFEVILGSILTQNTSWRNVEKALANLKRERLLSPDKILKLPAKELAELIRPSGYNNLKATRLKEVCSFIINETGGDLLKFSKQPLKKLRDYFLSVKGVGPETADSIILYAFGKPVFVVDTYTKRIFSRHGIIKHEKIPYAEVQKIVHDNFPNKVKLLNQFHALIVETSKKFCLKNNPKCHVCPLNGL
ncbi:endonuclease III-like protein [Candidatus Omnitrophus magneticus]|uniref:Endonuclease III-like protein n=1 Tax=Candidatus Omnitrophus magneticus TaxID=1609969 RepID=A0A0F0CUH4_9BACT|nr:endonuclease III-like protein [Candidatus Omnitrophus magneticus]